MKDWHHRENKGHVFSNRKMVQDYIARVVLQEEQKPEKTSSWLIGHHFIPSAKKKEGYSDNNIKKSYDLMTMLEELWLPTVMPIFGGVHKGNTPITVKQVQRAIAGKAVVITVDEFRTYVTCCHCLQRPQNVVSPVYMYTNKGTPFSLTNCFQSVFFILLRLKKNHRLL